MEQNRGSRHRCTHLQTIGLDQRTKASQCWIFLTHDTGKLITTCKMILLNFFLKMDQRPKYKSWNYKTSSWKHRSISVWPCVRWRYLIHDTNSISDFKENPIIRHRTQIKNRQNLKQTLHQRRYTKQTSSTWRDSMSLVVTETQSKITR